MCETLMSVRIAQRNLSRAGFVSDMQQRDL
jgi:hypothetical protein